MKRRFVFLHGFLGQGSDWDPIWEQRPPQLQAASFLAPDLFSTDQPAELLPFRQWAKSFVARHQLDSGEFTNTLVGYSLGGRLALHLLSEFPYAFAQAILFSTNPGGYETADRKTWEQAWGSRFLTEDWDHLLASWNSQEIFKGSPPPQRRLAKDFSRQLLAQSFEQWSSRSHDYNLDRVSTPIRWFVGSQDSKYLSLLTRMKSDGLPGDFIIVNGAGHRLPWYHLATGSEPASQGMLGSEVLYQSAAGNQATRNLHLNGSLE